MLLTINKRGAHISLNFYFEDRAPIKKTKANVRRKRIKTPRLDKPGDIGGMKYLF